MESELPCTFRIDGEYLIATPTVSDDNTPSRPYFLGIEYRARIQETSGREFNIFMEGYETALRKLERRDEEFHVMHDRQVITDLSHEPMKLVYCDRATHGPYFASACMELRANFPELRDDIPMSLWIRKAPAFIRETPLSEEELVQCKVSRKFVPTNGYVFPIALHGAYLPNDEETRAIPRGFNNYAIVRDHFNWSLRWPLRW